MRDHGTFRAGAALLALAFALGGVAAAGDGPPAKDTDGDGLSDFDEIHKYRTDPQKADTDGDGTPDGDWDERREHTYSIRVLLSHMPPAQAISDGWQDARETFREDDVVELEIVAYPLATPNSVLPSDADPVDASGPLATYVRPNLTCDFDAEMQAELRAALAKDGIDVDALGARELVEKVAAWAMKRVDAARTGFTICYVTEKDGALAIEPGLEDAAREARSDPGRTFEEQLDIEVRGASMFRKARSGACTSTAVYLQTILRALGVPTRTTVAPPPCDAGDGSQVAMLREGLRPSAFRDAILEGATEGAGGWVSHTFDVVWVGGRWMRLNYSRLGQPVVDSTYCGLLLRVLDYDDRATSGTAATWGRRYGLGLRSARFPYGNPYRLLAVSDRMGEHADVELPPPKPVVPPADHEVLTIVGSGWEHHPEEDLTLLRLDCAEWFDDQDGEQYRRFTEAVDRVLVLRAEDAPDVTVECSVGSITGTGVHAVAVMLLPDDVERIRPGVAYEIVPRNERGELRWAVADGVSVVRE